MIGLRKAMKNSSTSEESSQAHHYSTLYAEYKELIAKDFASNAVEEEESQAKVAIYDPAGEHYAEFFASDDEDDDQQQ